MSKEKRKMAQKILDTLTDPRFVNWHNKGPFNSWITGEFPEGDYRRLNEQILEDIEVLFLDK